MERPETKFPVQPAGWKQYPMGTEAGLVAPWGKMLLVLFATVDLVPTPVPKTKKVFSEEILVQRDEISFPRLLNKCICYLTLCNKLL